MRVDNDVLSRPPSQLWPDLERGLLLPLLLLVVNLLEATVDMRAKRNRLMDSRMFSIYILCQKNGLMRDLVLHRLRSISLTSSYGFWGVDLTVWPCSARVLADEAHSRLNTDCSSCLMNSMAVSNFRDDATRHISKTRTRGSKTS